MGKINKLPKNIWELIAAGEVVERPASVVKELLENSIDAGATDITVEIQNGGVRYIRITDNGCGIARDDVPLAFVSHATSKISSAQDLDAIMTLGFRGEALSSVAAVSKTEIITKTRDEEVGTRMEIFGGEQVSLDDAGCPNGTTIIIRELFYNTPARMKFLKSDKSEAMAVAGIVDKIALSHPEISIRFIKDGRQTLCTDGTGELKNAIYSVYGDEFSSSMIPVLYELNGMKIKGFVSKPFYARGSGSMQLFFANNRYIKSKTASAALNEAYKNSIMVGKYPACVLFIEMIPELLDVVRSWLVDARKIVVSDRERMNRMKSYVMSAEQMFTMIGMLQAIRVSVDSKAKVLKKEKESVYPLNQAQISQFTESLLIKKAMGETITLWDVYNAATDLYKANTMDIPNIMPQNRAMVEFLAGNYGV